MAKRDRDPPLQDEARRRDEWRGGDTQLPPDAGDGHTRPASEDNDEAFSEGRGDAVAHPRTIAPPD